MMFVRRRGERMMTSKGRLLRKVLPLFLAAFFLHSSTAFSVQIADIAYSLFGGDTFSASNHEFSISESLGDTFPTASMRATTDEYQYNYEIRGGSIEITPSQLLQDNSSGG